MNDTSDAIVFAKRVQSAALLVALITAGALIAIPLPGSPVPIVLQNMFVILTGIVLSVPWSLLTVSVYLAMGAIGLPVFAGATGGLAHFAGPTGGFLIGFLVAAAVVSSIYSAHQSSKSARWRLIVAIVCGLTTPYIFGIPWLSYVTGLSFQESLLAGLIPFVPGDLVKGLVLYLLVRRIPEPVWRRLT